jgi:hypothetical protein
MQLVERLFRILLKREQMLIARSVLSPPFRFLCHSYFVSYFHIVKSTQRSSVFVVVATSWNRMV